MSRLKSLDSALVVFFSVGVASLAQGQVIWHVSISECGASGMGTEEDPLCSIQDALDTSVDTDTILVAPGTYFEKIDFLGKAVVLRSIGGPKVTVLDATGLNDSAVKCVNGETASTVLDGFTITGGSGDTNNSFAPGTSQGGGMLNEFSSPTVRSCIFRENRVTVGGNDGGGMLNYESSPTVTDCDFIANSTRVGYGGGMLNRDNSSPLVMNTRFLGNFSGFYSGGAMANHRNCSPLVVNCIFVGNSTPGTDVPNGGAMQNREGSNPTIINSTFVGNTANGSGGALYNQGVFGSNPSFPVITNCIFWGNSDSGGTNEWSQIYDDSVSAANVSYSTVQGGWTGGGGLGILDLDPLLVDPNGPDNVLGTKDDNVRLLPESPCIDTGDNSVITVPTDLDGQTRVGDGEADGVAIVDMGAYEYHIPIIEVLIDIKPNSHSNSVNLGSHGVVPVAILTTGEFDATTVDPDTVKLAGSSVAIRGNGKRTLASHEDVDGDGYLDLMLRIETENLMLETGASEAVLTGETYDGERIEGVDSIVIVNE